VQHIFGQTQREKHIHDFLCIVFAFLNFEFVYGLRVRHASKLDSIWRIKVIPAGFGFFELVFDFNPNLMNVFNNASIEVFVYFRTDFLTLQVNSLANRKIYVFKLV